MGFQVFPCSVWAFSSGDVANLCQLWATEALGDSFVMKGYPNKLDLTMSWQRNSVWGLLCKLAALLHNKGGGSEERLARGNIFRNTVGRKKTLFFLILQFIMFGLACTPETQGLYPSN